MHIVDLLYPKHLHNIFFTILSPHPVYDFALRVREKCIHPYIPNFQGKFN